MSPMLSSLAARRRDAGASRGQRPRDDAPLGLCAPASLARLLRDQSRPADALALLDPVYDRFSEGFETADLESAKTLLDALGHAQ